MMWRAKYEKSLAMPTGWQQLPNGRAYCNALNAYFAPWFTKICGYQILKIGGLSAEIQCDLPLRHQISLSEKITENLTALLNKQKANIMFAFFYFMIKTSLTLLSRHRIHRVNFRLV